MLPGGFCKTPFSTNLDEFFMIRVAGIKQQIAAGVVSRSPDGMTPAEQLTAIRRVVNGHQDMQRRCWLQVLQPKLSTQGIHLLDYADLTGQQRTFCKACFEREVFPVLTPLAFDPSHPFPHISNLSLNLAVMINDPDEGELFARVKVPAVLPRLIPIDGGCGQGQDPSAPEHHHGFVLLKQVIAENVDALFPGMEVVEAYNFRITRNADVEIQEEEAADLLRTIEQGVWARRFGAVVRLTIQHTMPQRIRDLLLANLKLTPDDLYEVEGPLGLADLMALTKIDRPDLKDPPLYPTLPAILSNARSSAEIFAAIRQQDILLHHPYDSFQPLVELIEAAADATGMLQERAPDAKGAYRIGSAVDLQATFRKHEPDPAVFGSNAVISTSAPRIRAAVILTGSTPDSQAPIAVMGQLQSWDQPLPPLLIMDQAGSLGKTRADVDAVSQGQTSMVAHIPPTAADTGERLPPTLFRLSADGQMLTCPNGQQSRRQYPHPTTDGVRFTFRSRQCVGCPLWDACRGPESKPNVVRFVYVTAYHSYVRAAARFNQTDAGKALLKSRWQVEPTIAWLVRYQGCRQARRVGLAAAHCQLLMACAVRNLLLWLRRQERRG